MTLSQVPRELAERLTLDVAELPDRTSPDDWPEAMLVTDAELREMAEAVIREAMQRVLARADELRDELNCSCLNCVLKALRKELAAASSLTEQETTK